MPTATNHIIVQSNYYNKQEIVLESTQRYTENDVRRITATQQVATSTRNNCYTADGDFNKE